MTRISTLPDPDRQAEFYTSVPGKRLVAWLVDAFLVSVVTALIGILTLGIAWLFFPLFYAVIDFVYRWFTLASGSATLGMQLMAVEIRNWSGERLSSGEAALHTLAFLVCLAVPLLQLISIVLIAFGPRRQGLHDLLLGTTAINRPG